ncbi:phosphoribosylformylglycinamidine synthase subunit PurQ [Hydrogenimonas sp.]
MKIVVPQFPGTNCEYDTKYAFERLGHDVQIVWHEENLIPAGADLVVVPGGFSYGDYLRSGAIARFSPIMKAIKAYADNGGYVLGICNGFQILLESHLLPGAMKRNENLHFVSKHQYLKVENSDNRFLRKCRVGERLNIPIAHAEGNYFIEEEGLAALYDNGQVLLTYCDREGNPDNPNGSVGNIAGICNKERNVFGLMPHPERAMERILGSDDGIRMLEGFLS